MTATVSSVEFCLFTEDDVEALSVCHVQNGDGLDSLKQPIPHGLYDPAMGPIDKLASCTTCSQPYERCPGHTGHIVLPAPIYQPYLFNLLIKLLRAQCSFCHRFKFRSASLAMLQTKLELINRGRLYDADQIDTSSPSKAVQAAQESVDSDDDRDEIADDSDSGDAPVDRWEMVMERVEEICSRRSGGDVTRPHILLARRQVIRQFLRWAVPNKCLRCKHISPKLRSERAVKIYIVPLGSRQLAQAAKEGLSCELQGILDDAVADDDQRRSSSMLLLPNEAEKYLELLYDQAGSVLNLLFPQLTAHSFFLHRLVVPPSKYRPPVVMGDQTLENPENIYFRNIIEASKRFIAASTALAEKKPDVSVSDLYSAWVDLQTQTNMLMDSSKGPSISANARAVPGIRQRLEKKAGLFRQNMMGKRVNFSCRSVISPDPNLHVGEIGIPEQFARQLTYPEPVTAHNVELLRKMVINGIESDPGASFVSDADGRQISLAKRSRAQRIAIAQTLLAGDNISNDTLRNNTTVLGTQTKQKVVGRHLMNGDVVLVNRQPTLHKASMMAHRVRLLKNQQTIRMHYANCNTYNADFDGDEINVHFPQSELARAEGYNIACTEQQYLTCKDGTPLRGLIQDHVVAGVLITKRDSFFTRDEFMQLLYAATSSIVSSQVRLPCPIPAILKPKPLWTGKQVVSSLLSMIGQQLTPINIDSKSQIPGETWGSKSCEEGHVVVRQNQLLSGVLDKSQFGAKKFGLVHCVYELYGASHAADLLTALGQLFTAYLQIFHAFTCGIDDLLVRPFADRDRRSAICEASNLALQAAAKFAGCDDVFDEDNVRRQCGIRLRQTGAAGTKSLDGFVKSAMNAVTSSILSKCLPVGQFKPFPANNFSMMTISGAKGSKVNFSQISCLLGQQELEGARVPRMASGRTLPCFRTFDTQPRAGGWISNRFLTGIRPAEYFFHCMAGREGLVDTAVKTSRSGYLQRCLMKHLESLSVQYDYTVRNERGDVVMFYYGEDSVDVTKSLSLSDHGLLAQNHRAILHRLNPRVALTQLDPDQALFHWDRSVNDPDLPPIMSLFAPGATLGSVSESFHQKVSEFCQNSNNDRFFGKSGLTREKFVMMMWLKYMNSLAHPGENVGVLTAQSIGEPSTQMTLNTFHLAGFGGANVTLGIPRLVEIIMTASDHIKTPLMELYLKPGLDTVQDAQNLAHSLRQIKLEELIRQASCQENIGMGTDGTRQRLFAIRLDLNPLSDFKLCMKDVEIAIKKQFAPKLFALISKSSGIKISSRSVSSSENDEIAVEADEDHEDDDAPKSKKKKNGNSDNEQDSESDADSDENMSSESEAESEPESDRDDIAADVRSDPLLQTDSDDDKVYESSTGLKSPFLNRLAFSSNGLFVQLTLQLPLDAPRLLILSLIERVQSKVLVRATPKISKCYVTTRTVNKRDVNIVQTDGVNFQALWQYADLLDINQINTNDIAALLQTYGVECARAAIVREITSVFAVYGISVDYRHLYLLADYMTWNGGYRALNRVGIDDNGSPWLKMTYETSMKFLMDAILNGDDDIQLSPSSRIILGQVIRSGTGAFDLMQPISM